mmetsp:Transcript_50272/g.114084  ORF Transcript_50272/g.114084 Transcript_50272/m.114084 type:complete len:228 (-) Transcript_50272:43-726(-)
MGPRMELLGDPLPPVDPPVDSGGVFGGVLVEAPQHFELAFIHGARARHRHLQSPVERQAPRKAVPREVSERGIKTIHHQSSGSELRAADRPKTAFGGGRRWLDRPGLGPPSPLGQELCKGGGAVRRDEERTLGTHLSDVHVEALGAKLVQVGRVPRPFEKRMQKVVAVDVNVVETVLPWPPVRLPEGLGESLSEPREATRDPRAGHRGPRGAERRGRPGGNESVGDR